MPRGAVLVVDDDEDVIELLRFAIGEAGYPVYVARDGAEALQVLQDTPSIALLLTDYHMPVMDGAALVAKVRALESRANLPIVMFSGDPEIPAGVSSIKKPIDACCVLAVVRRHCDL